MQGRLFVREMEEPEGWTIKERNPKKHPSGEPLEYDFRSMLLVLLLMVYHKKEYRRMEAHLKNNHPHLFLEGTVVGEGSG